MGYQWGSILVASQATPRGIVVGGKRGGTLCGSDAVSAGGQLMLVARDPRRPRRGSRRAQPPGPAESGQGPPSLHRVQAVRRRHPRAGRTHGEPVLGAVRA
jgi:hypothetical protein